ncbi:MAG: protein kinase [Candidatus Obscuribacterales bacterium]
MESSESNKKPAARHPMIGHVIDSYQIIDLIGAGAMGAVFKANQISTGREVALKVLYSELANDSESVVRLKREARALAQLDHINIVKTFDFGTTAAGEPYLVIEYVYGVNLRDVLDNLILLPPAKAVPIFVQIADAVRAAHRKGILHRDLKPENIMLTDKPHEDTVKILDFGIAHFGAESQRLTRAGEVVGSPVYMSPEQLQGMELSEKSDIYQLGVIMYQMLTGEWPHYHDNYMETVKLKCTQKAPSFSKVVPGRAYPGSLEKIVLRCLEIKPEDRFPDMAELKSELELVRNAIRQTTRIDFPVQKPAPSELAASDSSDSGDNLPKRVPGFLLAESTTAGGGPGSREEELERAEDAVRRVRTPVKPNYLVMALVVVVVAVCSFMALSAIRPGQQPVANQPAAGETSAETEPGSSPRAGATANRSSSTGESASSPAGPGDESKVTSATAGDLEESAKSASKPGRGGASAAMKPEAMKPEAMKPGTMKPGAMKPGTMKPEAPAVAEKPAPKKAPPARKRKRHRPVTRAAAKPSAPAEPPRRRAYSTVQSYYASHGQ